MNVLTSAKHNYVLSMCDRCFSVLLHIILCLQMIYGSDGLSIKLARDVNNDQMLSAGPQTRAEPYPTAQYQVNPTFMRSAIHYSAIALLLSSLRILSSLSCCIFLQYGVQLVIRAIHLSYWKREVCPFGGPFFMILHHG